MRLTNCYHVCMYVCMYVVCGDSIYLSIYLTVAMGQETHDLHFGRPPQEEADDTGARPTECVVHRLNPLANIALCGK